MERTTVNPILLDIPDQLESERLLIRVPRAGDGPGVNAAILESLGTLRPWLAWAPTPPTIEQSEANCRQARAQFLLREKITLRLYLKGTDTVIGSSGFVRLDWSVPKFEIGYWIGQRHEGHGYATEAVRSIAAWAVGKLGARRLEIGVDNRNRASCRVAEKAGFTLEARQRCMKRGVNGEPCDVCLYVRIPA